MNDKTKTAKDVLETKKRKTVRPKEERIPFHKQRRIGLADINEEEYHYRLVNNLDDRIYRAKKAGYEIMDAEIRGGDKDAADASQMGKVGVQHVGAGVEAVYMRIPKDIWEKDQADKQTAIDEREKDLGLDKIEKSKRRGTVDINRGPLPKD